MKTHTKTWLTAMASAGAFLAGVFAFTASQAHADWTTPDVRQASEVAPNTVFATLQPNAGDTSWILTVSWNTISNMGLGSIDGTNNGFNLEDSITGSTLSNPTVLFADRQGDIVNTASDFTWEQTASYRPIWQNVGNFLPSTSSTYNNDALASGWGNVSLLNARGLDVDAGGVYMDQDAGEADDRSRGDCRLR